jgi:type VI secretion system protein ImpK
MDLVRSITNDCFNSIAQIRRSGSNLVVEPEEVHGKMVQLVRELQEKAKRAGLSQSTAMDMAYAVVAHADETALRRPGPLRDYWTQNMLQLLFFDENVAGVGFFDRLDRLRGEATIRPEAKQALTAYHLCLLLGFQGRYRVAGPGGTSELLKVREALARHLGLSGDEPIELAPKLARPADNVDPQRRRIPSPVLGGALLASALIFHLGLSIVAQRKAGDVVQRIKVQTGLAEERAQELREPSKIEGSSASIDAVRQVAPARPAVMPEPASNVVLTPDFAGEAGGTQNEGEESEAAEPRSSLELVARPEDTVLALGPRVQANPRPSQAPLPNLTRDEVPQFATPVEPISSAPAALPDLVVEP